MATEKKNDATLSVESRLKSLYELQTILSEIDRIKTIRGELPLEVKDLEDSLAGLHTRIDNYARDIEGLKHDVAAEREKIRSCQVLIDRYKEQLDNVRNNHEFDNLTKEIEYETLEIELAEKTIGEIERNIENHRNEIAATEAEITDQTHILEEKKAALENIVSETRAEEENLQVRAKKLEPLVDDERLLQAFKRIRSNARNGLGVVIVDRNACGGCFNRIPPQKQIEIKMHKKVIVCEYCGRIMVDPELAEEAIAEVGKN